ncbi:MULTISPECIES: glycosyltransferase family 39 protein [unclassified Cryobacterium]|uniref:glycosyltransferase family 39 protein n=1 Tax=unclassified Cryobacterium TaxID=2649013 RepID=UPI001304D1E7|nr:MULTISPECIES: glycosyltransferase family 39 protein [unclassified Cryobacterium]
MSAQRSLSSLFTMLTTVDAVHGTYYLGLHAWINVFGASPFSVRFPSAIAIGIAVAGIMHLTARLSSRRTALVAGIVCGILPRVTYMGEETRSYAFSAAIAAWLTVLLVEIIRRNGSSRWQWFAYAALSATGIYVFLYLILLVLAHAVILLNIRAPRGFLRKWFLYAAAAIILATPVVIWAVLERHQIGFLASRNEVTSRKLLVSLWFGSNQFAAIAWTLILVAGIAAVVIARRGRHDKHNVEVTAGGLRMPSLELVAASWLLVPAVVLIGGQFLVPVYTARYLSYSAPAAAILIASGLVVLTRNRMWALSLGVLLIVATAAPVYLAQRTPYAKNHSDWADISTLLGAHAKPGDAVDFDESVRPSRRPRLALHTYPAGFIGLRDITLKVPFSADPTWHDTAYTIAEAANLGRLADVDRVWLIEYSIESPNDYDKQQLAELGYTPVAHYETHRSVIYEYTLAGNPGP